MKVIQSFSISSSKKDFPLKHSYGWLSAEYHWLCWALSVLKINDCFGSIILVTDEIGKSILINQLELPYSEVDLSLETLDLDKYPPELWALGKLFVYKEQNQPFLHIDGDIILGNKFRNDFDGKSLIVQNIEKNIYYKVIDSINIHFSDFPDFLRAEHFTEDKDFYSINAGLVGGEDTDFFKDYVREAFEFVDKNLDFLEKLDDKLGYLNVVFEQLFFYHLAKIHEKSIFSYLSNPIEDAFYKEVIDIENYPNVELIHPVGTHKRSENLCRKIASILHDEYPRYYYKVIQMLSNAEHAFHLRFYQLIQWNDAKEMVFRKNKDQILYTFKPERINTKNALIKFNKNNGEIDDLFPILDELVANERAILIDANQYDQSIQDFFWENTADAEKLLKSYYSQKRNFTNKNLFFGKDLYEIHFQRNNNTQIVETKMNWGIFIDQYETIRSEEINDNYVALIFDVLELKVIPYYLSELECVIFEISEKEITLKQILSELSDCFDPQELKEDYVNFEKMVINILENLLKINVIFKK